MKAQITYWGAATVLLEIDPFRLLTDPQRYADLGMIRFCILLSQDGVFPRRSEQDR